VFFGIIEMMSRNRTVTDLLPQKIDQPFTREEAVQMLFDSRGTIDVVIGLGWDELRLDIESLNDLVEELIVDNEFTLGFLHSIEYTPVGFDPEKKQFLVRVTTDVDPHEWDQPQVVQCRRCNSAVAQGYCVDQTCPYSDWQQVVNAYDLSELTTVQVEAKYGIKKRLKES
jgi:hypothetical protein